MATFVCLIQFILIALIHHGPAAARVSERAVARAEHRLELKLSRAFAVAIADGADPSYFRAGILEAVFDLNRALEYGPPDRTVNAQRIVDRAGRRAFGNHEPLNKIERERLMTFWAALAESVNFDPGSDVAQVIGWHAPMGPVIATFSAGGFAVALASFALAHVHAPTVWSSYLPLGAAITIGVGSLIALLPPDRPRQIDHNRVGRDLNRCDLNLIAHQDQAS